MQSKRRVINVDKTWERLESLQPTVMKRLKNILIKKRVAHAYLFEGIKGTGKREIGLFFSKALYCENLIDGFRPCGECHSCKRIDSGNHPDIHMIEPDGASIKKEQIANLQLEFAKKSVESNRKFYMIVHADKMTTNAANSLLKFLEEPQAQTTAILITEQMQKILPTILSRCQHIPFQPIPKHELVQMLIEKGVKAERAPLLANLTNNIDEALHLKDDEWFLQARKLVLKLYEIQSKKSLMDALLFLQTDWLLHFKTREQIDIGLDMLLFIYKDLLYIRLEKDRELVYPDNKLEWNQDALLISDDRLTGKILAIMEAKKRLQANVNSALLLEQLLIKLKEG